MATPVYYFDTSKIGKDFTGKKDVSLLTNELAVLESVKNILVTEPGERVWYPEFGCPLSKYIFEPIDGITAISLKTTIMDAIHKFIEDRIDNLAVNVTASPDEQTISIDVIFNIKTSDKQQTLSLTLNKIR
jgi:phage baseplate assembly protein W